MEILLEQGRATGPVKLHVVDQTHLRFKNPRRPRNGARSPRFRISPVAWFTPFIAPLSSSHRSVLLSYIDTSVFTLEATFFHSSSLIYFAFSINLLDFTIQTLWDLILQFLPRTIQTHHPLRMITVNTSSHYQTMMILMLTPILLTTMTMKMSRNRDALMNNRNDIRKEIERKFIKFLTYNSNYTILRQEKEIWLLQKILNQKRKKWKALIIKSFNRTLWDAYHAADMGRLSFGPRGRRWEWWQLGESGRRQEHQSRARRTGP